MSEPGETTEKQRKQTSKWKFFCFRSRKPRDLGWIRFPNLRWDDEAQIKASLQGLYEYAEHLMQDAIDWYFRKKGAKRISGSFLRFLAIFFAGAGTIIPLLTPLGESVFKFDFQSIAPFGYVALALAGLCVGVDRFFGYSAGWIRYVATAMKLRKLQSDFYMDWTVLMSNLDGKTPNASQREALVRRVHALADQALTELERETAEWAAEYTSRLSELEKNAKTQLEAWKPGTIIVKISNLEECGGRVTVSVDDRQTQSATSETCRVAPVFPGSHFVTVRGEIGGKPAVASSETAVGAGETVTVALTLKA